MKGGAAMITRGEADRRKKMRDAEEQQLAARKDGILEERMDFWDLCDVEIVKGPMIHVKVGESAKRKPRFANVECERLPDGRIKVLGFKNFLTPAQIKERIGGRLYQVWLNGPHMYPVTAEWIRTIWISATYQGSHALLMVGEAYQPADLEGRIDYLRECGKRLGELVKLRKRQLAEEARQKMAQKMTFEI